MLLYLYKYDEMMYNNHNARKVAGIILLRLEDI